MPAELHVTNPYNGSELATLRFASREEIRAQLERAGRAFERWRNSQAWERAQLLEDAAARLTTEREAFAALIRDEAGKPITYARGEVERAISVLKWAAAEAQRFAGETLRLDAARSGRPGFGIVNRFPRGVVLGITPFNFPLNLVLHKIAPAIASGCSILIKPSPFTPLTALKLATLFSGAPDLVQIALADDDATAELTHAPEIAMVSFTGSARVGMLVRKQAEGKPVTLELGGNAWVAVLEDVSEDLFPAIAKRIAGGAYGYAGQSCISVQNAAVSRELFAKLAPRLADATRATAFGDPSSEKVVSGPVINAAGAARIRKELGALPKTFEQTSASGAVGGDVRSDTMIAPTLVTLPGSRPPARNEAGYSLIQEEIFGPVMTAQAFDSLDDLIARVNSGRYGLQAGVFTQNLAAIERLHRELRVGGLIVNDVPTTRYDHQPYGGVKDSGQGREGIRYAMEEMTEPRFLALSSTFHN